MTKKISAEQAAERGVIVGQPYTPPGRTGAFDVPDYDDIADLQVLFKRFANTAASFTEAGGGPFVDKTGDFTIEKTGLFKTYLCLSSALMNVSVPNPTTLTDGDRFNLIQGGTGKAELTGVSIVGLSQTAGQYQGLTATVHDGKWWCVPFGSSGGGATGPIPVFALAASVTINVTQAGGLFAMDATAENLSVTIPKTSNIPVGSAYVVSNVGNSSKNRVTVKSDAGVTILNRQSAVIERFRLVSIVKQVDGADISGNDVWLLNAGGGGGGKAVPSEPTLTSCYGVSGGATVIWQAPSDDGGSPLTGYFVEQSINDNDWFTSGSVSGQTLTFTVDDLTPDEEYSFRVKAINENGISNPSNVLKTTPSAIFNEATGGVITEYSVNDRNYRVHTFTGVNVLNVQKSTNPFRVLLVGGGGSGGHGAPYYARGGVGGNGQTIDASLVLEVGNVAINVAVAGGSTKIQTLTAAAGGNGGDGYDNAGTYTDGPSGTGHAYVSSNIAGTAITYSAGPGASGAGGQPGAPGGNPGGGGGGGGGNTNEGAASQSGGSGGLGLAIVSYEVAPFNSAGGGTVTEYEKDGKTFRVHSFTSNGSLIVSRAVSPFRILAVASGDGGVPMDGPSVGTGGSGGGVNDGSRELITSPFNVTVGAASGIGPAQGGDSSLGDFVARRGTGAGGGAGNAQPDAGSVGSNGGTGTNSDITGTSQYYGSGGGGGGGIASAQSSNGPGTYGIGGHGGSWSDNPTRGSGGTQGIVVVSYQIAGDV